MLSGETVLAFQSVFLVLLFVSIAFRMKGNYLVHGIIMTVLTAGAWVAVVGTLPMFMDSSIMQNYTSPSSTLVVSGLHLFIGVAELVFGTWLVALWRPRSTDFAAKSKRIWQSIVILWVLAYMVGLLLYVALTTTFL